LCIPVQTTSLLPELFDKSFLEIEKLLTYKRVVILMLAIMHFVEQAHDVAVAVFPIWFNEIVFSL